MVMDEGYPVTEQRPTVISVCIANYNGREVLAECLASVFAQRINGMLEVIVHDDASTDNSFELVGTYPNAHLIRSESNVGYCASNNRMASAATGRYLLLLNNDAILLPNALQCLLDTARSAVDVGICSLAQYDYRTGAMIDCGMTLDPFLNPVPVLPESGAQPVMAIGACLFIRKSLWETIGGFPEWYGSLAEDMFLCLYARILGYRVAIASQSGFKHHLGHSFGGGKETPRGLSSTYRRRQLSERNKTFNMFLFYPTLALAVILPVHSVLLLLEGLAFAAHDRSLKPLSLIYVPALSSLITRFRELLKLRSAIQSFRRTDMRTFFRSFDCRPRKLIMLLRHGWPRLT